MFTGIVETVGRIALRQKNTITIEAPFSKTLKPGQSVSVNGACLTIVKQDRQKFQVQVLEETKRLTNLGDLKPGDLVNLERAVKIGERLDGHIVEGHVEGVGRIRALETLGDKILRIAVSKKLLKYMIFKGIVILDGIAFTITRLDDRKSEIEVAVTPYTWKNTNLYMRKLGDKINIETDVIGKYVERLVSV